VREGQSLFERRVLGSWPIVIAVVAGAPYPDHPVAWWNLKLLPIVSYLRLIASDLDILYGVGGIIQVEYHIHNP
jgi:hypothetical protein